MPSRIAHPEDDLQLDVIEQVLARGVRGLVFWHTPNSSKMGGKRTLSGVPLAAIRGKRLGVRAGVLDLAFLYCARIFFLELKIPPNNLSDEQRDFIADAEAQGATCATAYSFDEAIRALESWRLLRGTMQ